MPRVAFPLTNFQDTDGSPVSLGYLLIHLVDDAKASSGQVCSKIKTQIFLDSSGNVLGSPAFWQNSALTPSTLYYVLEVYSQGGQLLSGPTKIVI